MYRTNEGEILDVRSEETRAFLRKHYPAIMADRPIGMSEGYQFMPSYKIAEALIEKFNVGLVSVSQQFSRNRNPNGQEHYMRFRLPSAINLKSVGDSVPELVVMNSHNGRSTLRAYAGVFRLVCSNGMVVADRSFGRISLRHFGIENTFSAFQSVLDGMAVNFSRMDLRMKVLDELMMTPGQQIGLARAMMKARGVPGWVEPEMVLRARREIEQPNSDGFRSIWKTYNVVQESLTQASDVNYHREGARARSLRPLSGARAQILINESMWDAMEEFVTKRWPELASEIIDAKAQEVKELQPVQVISQEKVEDPATGEAENATEVVEPVAMPVVAEDQAPDEAGHKTIILRGFEELITLSYEEMNAISVEELNALGKDQRSKLSKRKSYLKSKVNA